MPNRLREVRPHVHRLSAAEAEVWVLVVADEVTPTTEVRGRLVGPRCPGTTTIEVAYPLQPFPRRPDDVPPLSRCVSIPDPSLWEPSRPFVYQAIVELWQDGQMCERRELEIGLRMAGRSRLV